MKYALLIEYDGTDFAGWQVQPRVRTVQGELEDALKTLFGKSITLFGSGRTDSGVHARAMVAHCELELSELLPIWKLTEALNSLTGHDIAIREVREVNEDFHSRFSALERTYRYSITKKRKIAIGRQYSWCIANELDVNAMGILFTSLVGDYDFTSFSKNTEDVEHFRCIVTQARMDVSDDEIVLWISANRFVRGMVRALVGATVEVGKGRLSAEQFDALLKEPVEADRARYLAPAHGLTFWGIRYREEFGLWL